MSKHSYTWKDILYELTKTTDIPCSVRLLDTIFIDSQNLVNAWYFTTKNGIVSKKKAEKSTFEAISTRFNRFSMSNPNNTHQYVGTVMTDSHRKYLTESELASYFSASSTESDTTKSLQVYLRPYNGVDLVVRAYFRVQGNHENLQFAVQLLDKKESNDLSKLPDSTFICDQCKIFTREIIKALNLLNSDRVVTELTAEFIVDDNRHVWLSKISRAICHTLPLDVESPDLLASSLPELPNSSQSTRKSQVIEQSLSAQYSDTEFSEALMWREGGVYHCKVGPEGLPGLRVWILTSISRQQTPSHNDWRIDFDEMTQSPPTDNDVFQNRLDITRTLPIKFVLLIEHFQELLRNSNPQATSVVEYIAKWKSRYNDFLKHMKEKKLKSSSEVSVDGNVHAISQKLQSLIEINFEAKAAVKVFLPRVISSPV